MPRTTVTAREVCRISNLEPGTLRVWKSRWRARGFNMLSASEEGWSRYTFQDAIKLTLLVKLADLGISVASSRGEKNPVSDVLGKGVDRTDRLLGAIQRITRFADDTTWFVVSTVRIEWPVTASKQEDISKTHLPSIIFAGVVPGRDLTDTLADPDRHASVVVNLDELRKQVEARWPKD